MTEPVTLPPDLGHRSLSPRRRLQLQRPHRGAEQYPAPAYPPADLQLLLASYLIFSKELGEAIPGCEVHLALVSQSRPYSVHLHRSPPKELSSILTPLHTRSIPDGAKGPQFHC